MLDVLLESRATRSRRPGGTLASAVIHGAIAAAIIGLAKTHTADAVSRIKPHEGPTYVPMPSKPRAAEGSASGARRANGSTAARRGALVFTATHLPPIDLPLRDVTALDSVAAPTDGLTLMRDARGSVGRPDGGSAFDELVVDRAPRVLGKALEPRYPSVLREAGIQARVVAEFVVDTLGRAEMDGLRIEAPNPMFADAVREVLARYRFTPGETAGIRVRTRVQLPFDFKLTR